jgi:AcrR family transcriptional regulator
MIDFVADNFDRKQELLEAELRHYFGEICPTLVARWQAAITGLAPPFLRELASRLKELDEVTQEINRQLRIALRPVSDGSSTEPVIDQALASLEHLNEIAESMMRRLDELLTAA